MKQLLTTKQVARAIGVSEASVKRWCDKGAVPCARTAGGHRRLTLCGIIEFLRRNGHELVEPEVLGLPADTGRRECAVERCAKAFHRSLVAADEQHMRRMIYDLYLAGRTFREIMDRHLAPAVRALGECWAHGELEVFEERRAVEMALRAVYEMRCILGPVCNEAPVAIGASLEHDPYTLPTAMVEVTMRELGWRAQSVGAGLPAATIATAVRRARPKICWLSVSTFPDLARFVGDYAIVADAARGCGSAMVVGGRAMNDETRHAIRYAAYCDALGHLVAFAETIYQRSAACVDAALPDRAVS
ncbi:MAG: hypothetical protein CHACPFDD_00682 [Phycisphaerae bacterium]|nr:hypothetical protein [Phycisphaerae bacterium]